MTHEEYLEMNSKVKKFVELNTKKADLLSLKADLNEGGSISVVRKNVYIKNVDELDIDLHERIKEVVNFEIGKIVENITIEMSKI